MSLKVGDYVLIYKNKSEVLFSEAGRKEDLKHRMSELNKSNFFTAYIVKVVKIPNQTI